MNPHDLTDLAARAEDDEDSVTDTQLRDVFYGITRPGGISWPVFLSRWFTLRNLIAQHNRLVNYEIAPEQVIGDDDARLAGEQARAFARDQLEQQIDSLAAALTAQPKAA